MKKRNNLLVFLLFLFIQGYGQKIVTSEYDWSATPGWKESGAEKNKESYVYMKNYIMIEYIKSSNDVYYAQQTFHYIIYVADDNAVDAFNKVYIPFTNGIDIINIKARTYNKEGKVVLFDKKNIKDAENLEDKGRYKLFALDGVVKGNMIEVLYTIKKSADYYGSITLQKPVVCRDVLFQIASPKNLHFTLKVHNGKGIHCDSVNSSKRYNNYYFDSIPALKEEKYSNYNSSRLQIDYKFSYNDLVNKSEQYTYASAAQDIYEALYKEWDDSKKKFKKIIKELKLESLSTDDKISRIENYVKSNYALKEFPGVDNSNSIDFILKNKATEELGIAKLFAMLFKSAEIENQACLTASRDKMMLDPDYMSWLYLETYLFYFPQTGKYLSPVDYEYRYPMFPFMLMNNYGLFIKTIEVGEITTALPELKKIPISKAAESYTNIEASVKFDENHQNALIEMKQKFLGYNAMFIHPYFKYMDEAKQKDFVNDYLKSISEDVVVKKYNVTNFNPELPPLKDPFTIETTLSIASLIEQAGDNILFKVGFLIGKQAQLYTEEKRQTELDMYFPHSLNRILKIEIPTGYKVKGLESTVFLFKGNNMLFESKNRIEGNYVIIDIVEQYINLTFPVSDYETLRKVINAAADFNNSVIIFEKMK